MEPEVELDFFDIVKDFNRMGVKHLIIGRRAVVLYGAPVLTADYDFWIDSGDKTKVLTYFVNKGCDLSDSGDSRKPIIQVYAGLTKIDLFFHKTVTNLEGELLEFVSCYENATVKEDPEEDVFFRIPSIDDLIRTKKIRKENVKDLQDIEYLLKAKTMKKT
ncbi:MAG: hypothetical protein JRJ86_12320 [Deltaproteobacteria bacterium]|nr:hypothetical protein [Deltaproteobacteria bacterium]MBW2116776.1 hypothetical protein [Deltaproteobacteria bacterium]MBW2345044.1 hypothetical protein [Deltaproteobacteria bacterium]